MVLCNLCVQNFLHTSYTFWHFHLAILREVTVSFAKKYSNKISHNISTYAVISVEENFRGFGQNDAYKCKIMLVKQN